jgi:hypothetical protein
MSPAAPAWARGSAWPLAWTGGRATLGAALAAGASGPATDAVTGSRASYNSLIRFAP